MILPKREDGFFPEREDLPLFEVTAETGLWYGLLDAEKVHKPKKKHAQHLTHAQSFKMNSKKVVWYSTVKIVNTFMPWISKVTIILDKMLQVFMRTSQLTFLRSSRATELSK